MIIIPPPWPDSLKAICRNDCAERGEPPCWEVDEETPAAFGHPARGKVCDDCLMAWAGPQSRAALDVLAERRRQQEVEGWTADHDDRHVRGELGAMAACYAVPSRLRDMAAATFWPATICRSWFKPAGAFDDDCARRRDLVRAAALLIAEIERLDRRYEPG